MQRAIELLYNQAKAWKIELSASQLESLNAYADLLANYELANVIGTRDRHKIVTEHLVDSVSCLPIEDAYRADYLIDVGTGGGLPGIPISIACPKIQVTLLEAREKKVCFLEHVRAQLNLSNLEILCSRAEDVGKKVGFREVFNVATARALAKLPLLLEYCAPFVRSGGTILAMKGKLSEEELSKGVLASRGLGTALREVHEVDYLASFPEKERQIAIFDKISATPERFPRRTGVAKKRPLGEQYTGKP